ncbi:MAG TPA: GNAT family N-acetyltransferase [Anaeromyxobacteraceae bacterium]|nr:GNAT family N-acetyltransferase [Anaeromyxobacteraceae bacterium]
MAHASEPLRIRIGRPDDAPAAAAVMRASIRSLARGCYPPSRLAAWASLPPLYHRWAMTAGGERYLVATRGDRVVGYAAVHGAELTALFVRPGEARRGTGSALLARAERLSGARVLTVKSARSGVDFYRARGFVEKGPALVPLPGGGALEAILLEKRVSRATSARTAGGTGTAGTRRATRAAGRRRSPRRSAPGRRARPSSR